MDTFVDFLSAISWHNILAAGLRILVVLVAAWIAMYLLRRGLHRLEQQLALRTRKEGERPSASTH